MKRWNFKSKSKAKRNVAPTKQPPNGGMPKIRPLVAGIDVGSEKHFVCAPTSDGGTEMRVFGTTTPDLQAILEWLQEAHVESVAMESTGVYWIPLYELLDSHGIEVILTDTRQFSRIPGRKTDAEDCQWIQQLHSCGLLQGCFRPQDIICHLRSLVREKAVFVAEQADWLRRMQKCMDQMNVRVHRAVSDINGTTGMAILRAIVAGERDPVQLAKLRDPRCQKSQATMAKELTGNWRADHLFNLEQGLKMYDTLANHIADYQREIQRRMEGLRCEKADRQPLPPVKNKEKAKAIKRRGQEPMRRVLHGMTGVDLTTIDGIGVETAEIIQSEYGIHLNEFPSEKQFVKHLRLAPRQSITGGKPQRKGKGKKSVTRTGQALKTGATSLRHSRTALGAYYRKVAAHKDSATAVFATARKMAQYAYRLLHYGQAYVDEGAIAFEKRYEAARLNRTAVTADQLGYKLVPKTAAA
jgi:transposase